LAPRAESRERKAAGRFVVGYRIFDFIIQGRNGMASEDNLMAAFAGESQANRKYLAFAKKAEADGFKQIAKLFRAAAAAETIHALAHFRVAGHVKDTVANLQAAMEGEQHEFTSMYPGFIATAIAEGNKAAQRSFERANAVEQTHHALYREAYEAARAGKDLPEGDLYICDICGHTVAGEPPDSCPVCGALRQQFSKVE
jgi:rubrerythrin